MIRRFLLLTQVPVFKNFNIILPSELTAPPEKKGGRITAAVDYHSAPSCLVGKIVASSDSYLTT